MVADVIAVKRRFRLDYTSLSQDEVDIFVTEFERLEFLTFHYPDRGVVRSTVVWFQYLPRELLLAQPAEWYGPVSIILEEQ